MITVGEVVVAVVELYMWWLANEVEVERAGLVLGGAPPDGLELGGEELLLADDDGDVVLVVVDGDARAGHPGADGEGALHGEQLVVAAVEEGHLAAELAGDHVQVGAHLAGAEAHDVVQGVPRRVVGVAHERLDQERPHPAASTHTRTYSQLAPGIHSLSVTIHANGS